MLQDMRLMRMERTGAVNVEVDGPKPVDLSVVLQETRDQYEAVVEKNKEELEIWLKSKVRHQSRRPEMLQCRNDDADYNLIIIICVC